MGIITQGIGLLIHAITDVAFHSANNWKTFASNGSGEVVEIANGSTSGHVWTSTGPSSLPIWQAVAGGGGSGDVTDAMSWGRYRKVKNSYLLNDTVPSNISGRTVKVTTGNITVIGVTCESNSSATVEIRRKVGAVYSVIASTALSAQRKKTDKLSTPIAVALDDELSAYINGTMINPVVSVLVQGTP